MGREDEMAATANSEKVERRTGIAERNIRVGKDDESTKGNGVDECVVRKRGKSGVVLKREKMVTESAATRLSSQNHFQCTGIGRFGGPSRYSHCIS
jgi:hypothetical protein